MKLFVLALFISFALCVPATVDVDALHDLSVRLSFDIDAQINITQTSVLASLQANFTADLTGFLATLNKVQNSTDTTLQGQLTNAQTAFQAAWQAFVAKASTITGTVNGLALLVRQVGDAKAAIQLECEDLQQALLEASAAVQQSLSFKFQAKLNVTSKSIELAAAITALQAAKLTGVPATIAAAEQNAQALLFDLSLATAKGQVYDSLHAQIENFITNNTDAITECRTAVEQRLAALALGITADWNTVRQQVAQDVADFKARVSTIVSRVVGDALAALNVLEVKIDDVAHDVTVQVSVAVSANFDVSVTAAQQRLVSILKAVGVALCGGNVDVVVLSSTGWNATFELTLSGNAQINLPSLGLVVQTDLAAAVSRFQAQVAASLAAANASVDALRLALKNLTQTQIDAATAAIKVDFNAAYQAWNATKQAWNAKVVAFNTLVATAKQAILNAAVTANVQASNILSVRKAELDAKLAELNATVDQFKANLQSLSIDEQTIKSAILSAQANLTAAISAGNVDLQAELNASISVLFDTYGQKVAAAAVVNINLDNFQANLSAVFKAISDEQNDIAARITAFQGKLSTTFANIKARLDGQEAQIKSRIQEVAVAIDANIQSVVATFQEFSASINVSVSVNFGANVTVDEVQAIISAYLKAEFSTNNVVVTRKSSSKRNALGSSADYEAAVGAANDDSPNPNPNPSSPPITISDATPIPAVSLVLLLALILQLLW